ncbi:glycosyltransferase family 2 protein [Neisseria yangbaofengii]|uniref:glycosyltransferase family 2 protein n=1 Tax=Neisseria yangbaofengii TaxID=2709396 RepID=UPI0013ECB5F1|nr:glycosyltransferase [Neisseria yangbaofengii]
MKQSGTPLVTVMIPYYNCGKYIAETLESVDSQHYPNLEIVVVDDGSNTTEATQLDNILKNYPHIHLIRQDNKGLSAARNAASRIAKGSYYLFLDADDLILPDYISECVAVLEGRPDCKLVYPQTEFFDAQTGLWKLPPYKNLKKLLEGNHIPAIALHRAEDFHRLGGFDENLKSHEDWDLWIRMLEYGGEAHQIDRILFRYRRRQDQSSLSNHLINQTEAVKASWQDVYIKHGCLFNKHGLGYYDLIHDLRKQSKQSLLKKLINCLKGKQN